MNLDINDFTYDLPQERIAQYPLPERDQSRLLVYKKGKITHEKFTNVGDFLPSDSALFFNETKVIPARLFFQKESGAIIEIFLLSPVKPSSRLLETMQSTRSCSWKCTIGNLRRWSDLSLAKKIGEVTLSATLEDRQEGTVKFSWNSEATFAEILQRIGNTPLPPYIKRSADDLDKERYQTVYSNQEGAVAAPTAGLHFTEPVFKSLKSKNIVTDFLTLHVSAGTFQPIKVKNPLEHAMHQEQVVVSRENIENILKRKNVVAVGTTSLRTLESLYWYGVRLLESRSSVFDIKQEEPYVHENLPTATEAITAVGSYMDLTNKRCITGHTSIYILPGYSFRICRGLITNFHQPASTLILLVAAFVGNDWRKIYEEALNNGYRFLSYGDSSLLLSEHNPLG